MKAQNYAMIINAQQNLKTAQAAQQAADEAAESDTSVNDFKFVINDYPQQVRWKLTHRDTIAEINDFTGAYLGVLCCANFISNSGRVISKQRLSRIYLSPPPEVTITHHYSIAITILSLCDAGAAVTTRGSYYPPGKEAGADKLHLLVEAPDQMALTKAKGEIKRIVGASLLRITGAVLAAHVALGMLCAGHVVN